MSDQLERNKQTAIAFYEPHVQPGKPAEAIRKYVGDTYIQHNPGVADGRRRSSASSRRWRRTTRTSGCT